MNKKLSLEDALRIGVKDEILRPMLAAWIENNGLVRLCHELGPCFKDAEKAIIAALKRVQTEARYIEAEAGKYPMNGEALLAILRGIADDEAQGVDKDRKRGAAYACQRCIGAVESWLRSIPSPLERTSPNPKELYRDQERFICLLANVKCWPEWDRWKAGNYETNEMRAEIDAFCASVKCLRQNEGCKFPDCACKQSTPQSHTGQEKS